MGVGSIGGMAGCIGSTGSVDAADVIDSAGVTEASGTGADISIGGAGGGGKTSSPGIGM